MQYNGELSCRDEGMTLNECYEAYDGARNE